MPNMPKMQPTSSDRHRFHLLDGLRGIAAASIVIWHAPSYLGTRNFLHQAFLAVDFFFCLSGFVIAFSYEKRILSGLKVGDFFIMRLIRLYPVYWIGTMLGSLFLLVDLGLENALHLKARLLALFLLSLTLLPGFNSIDSLALFPLDPPAWSLFMELIGNVVIAWLLFKHFANNWVLSFLAILSLLVLIHWTRPGWNVDCGWVYARSNFVLGMARVFLSFTIGILLLRLSRYRPLPKIQGWLLPSAIIALLAFALVAPFTLLRTQSFQLLTVSVLFPLMVYFGALANPPGSWTRACVFLGEASYPLYLLHLTLLRILNISYVVSFLSSNHFFGKVAVGVVTLIITVVSYGVAKMYDEPVRKFLFKRYTASIQPRLNPVTQ